LAASYLGAMELKTPLTLPDSGMGRRL